VPNGSFLFPFQTPRRIIDDHEGHEASDLETARHEAIKIAREFIEFHGRRFRRNWSGWVVHVLDQQKSELFALSFAEIHAGGDERLRDGRQ